MTLFGKGSRFACTVLALLAAGASHAAVPVTVAPLSTQLVDLEVRAPATVVPANRAVVSAQVTALIDAVAADVGATVKRGDPLVRLDDREVRLGLERARADLEALDAQIEQAASRLRRGEELIASNFISDDDLLERRTTLSVLRANRRAQELAVGNAELTLSRTRIDAPFDAAVVERSAQLGSLAQPGTPLLTLVETSNREVDADLDPRYAADIGSADGLRFESQGRRYPLEAARVSPIIDVNTRIQKGRFVFTGAAAAIGASGEVVWLDAAGLLPVPLIVQRDGALGVFVADADRARFVRLPTAQEGRPARADLPPDALVVVRGQSRLQEGDELAITRQ